MSLELLKIKGNIPLKGKISASGAKNVITKLLVASVLSDQEYIFQNVPSIGDLEITVNLLREIGSKIQWDKKEKVLTIQTAEIHSSYIPQKFSGANRIPILMIGSLLGRTTNDIIVPTVGGDALGNRPVNFHIQALQKLGAEIEYREMKQEGAYFAHAHHGLTGAIIDLPYSSVGATENALLAGASAKGTTVIKNAALEPEVIDLILFLQKMGVSVGIDSERTINVEGTTKFDPAEHTVICDRNEIASYAVAAISTKGRVFIEGARQDHMLSFLRFLTKAGGGFTTKPNGIEFFYRGMLKGGLHIETGVHPGFMTDWQQPFCLLLTQSEGSSVIHETVYENRFGYTHTLKQMGADVELFKECLGKRPCRYAYQNHHHSLVVKGPTVLKAKNISIPDLRAGFAYVVAALLAKETSTISNVHYLDRGYEDLDQKLSSLGADIKRVRFKKEKKPTTSAVTCLK